MNAAEQAVAVRRGAGLFRRLPRGIVEVTGDDRTRWLAGMISADVSQLGSAPGRSGCYATLLTAQGRIVADLQVLARPEAYWLDVEAPALPAVLARLSKYIVADAVELADRTADFERLGLEGPAAAAILARAGAAAPDLAPDACADVTIAGANVVLAAFGWSGEAGFQIAAPTAAADAVAARIAEAGAGLGLVAADPSALEILRIEAGVPRWGAELDESVLPAEAGLERALSNKRCYTGQEIVERMRSRGQVSHRLVGLAAAAGEPLAAGAEVHVDGRRVGAVTSSCVSPTAGSVALAYVRRAHAEPGTLLDVDGRVARVVALPFVAASPMLRPE